MKAEMSLSEIAFCLEQMHGRVLEIGYYKGGSAMEWLKRADRVASIDVAPAAGPIDDPRFKLFVGDRACVPEAVSWLGGVIDVAFIDGSHQYPDVVHDAMAVWEYMSDCGVILFHDVFYDSVCSAIAEMIRRFESEIVCHRCGVSFMHVTQHAVYGGIYGLWLKKKGR